MPETIPQRMERIAHEQNVDLRVAHRVALAESRLERRRAESPATPEGNKE